MARYDASRGGIHNEDSSSTNESINSTDDELEDAFADLTRREQEIAPIMSMLGAANIKPESQQSLWQDDDDGGAGTSNRVLKGVRDPIYRAPEIDVQAMMGGEDATAEISVNSNSCTSISGQQDGSDDDDDEYGDSRINCSRSDSGSEDEESSLDGSYSSSSSETRSSSHRRVSDASDDSCSEEEVSEESTKDDGRMSSSNSSATSFSSDEGEASDASDDSNGSEEEVGKESIKDDDRLSEVSASSEFNEAFEELAQREMEITPIMSLTAVTSNRRQSDYDSSVSSRGSVRSRKSLQNQNAIFDGVVQFEQHDNHSVSTVKSASSDEEDDFVAKSDAHQSKLADLSPVADVSKLPSTQIVNQSLMSSASSKGVSVNPLECGVHDDADIDHSMDDESSEGISSSGFASVGNRDDDSFQERAKAHQHKSSRIAVVDTSKSRQRKYCDASSISGKSAADIPLFSGAVDEGIEKNCDMPIGCVASAANKNEDPNDGDLLFEDRVEALEEKKCRTPSLTVDEIAQRNEQNRSVRKFEDVCSDKAEASSCNATTNPPYVANEVDTHASNTDDDDFQSRVFGKKEKQIARIREQSIAISSIVRDPRVSRNVVDDLPPTDENVARAKKGSSVSKKTDPHIPDKGRKNVSKSVNEQEETADEFEGKFQSVNRRTANISISTVTRNTKSRSRENRFKGDNKATPKTKSASETKSRRAKEDPQSTKTANTVNAESPDTSRSRKSKRGTERDPKQRAISNDKDDKGDARLKAERVAAKKNQRRLKEEAQPGAKRAASEAAEREQRLRKEKAAVEATQLEREKETAEKAECRLKGEARLATEIKVAAAAEKDQHLKEDKNATVQAVQIAIQTETAESEQCRLEGESLLKAECAVATTGEERIAKEPELQNLESERLAEQEEADRFKEEHAITEAQAAKLEEEARLEAERLAAAAEKEKIAKDLDEQLAQEDEARRRLEEQSAAEAEAVRLEEEVRLAEEARLGEEARLTKLARLEEEAQLAEAARLKEEARLAESARVEEEAFLEAVREATRLEEESRLEAEHEAARLKKEAHLVAMLGAERSKEEDRLEAKREAERLEEEARFEAEHAAALVEAKLGEDARLEAERETVRLKEEACLEAERVVAKAEEERVANVAAEEKKDAEAARLKEEVQLDDELLTAAAEVDRTSKKQDLQCLEADRFDAEEQASTKAQEARLDTKRAAGEKEARRLQAENAAAESGVETAGLEEDARLESDHAETVDAKEEKSCLVAARSAVAAEKVRSAKELELEHLIVEPLAVEKKTQWLQEEQLAVKAAAVAASLEEKCTATAAEEEQRHAVEEEEPPPTDGDTAKDEIKPTEEAIVDKSSDSEDGTQENFSPVNDGSGIMDKAAIEEGNPEAAAAVFEAEEHSSSAFEAAEEALAAVFEAEAKMAPSTDASDTSVKDDCENMEEAPVAQATLTERIEPPSNCSMEKEDDPCNLVESEELNYTRASQDFANLSESSKDKEILLAMEKAASRNPHLTPPEVKALVDGHYEEARILDDMSKQKPTKFSQMRKWVKERADRHYFYADIINKDKQIIELREQLISTHRLLRGYRAQGYRLHRKYAADRRLMQNQLLSVQGTLANKQQIFASSGNSGSEMYVRALERAAKKKKQTREASPEEIQLETQMCRKMHQAVLLEQQKAKSKRNLENTKQFLQQCRSWLAEDNDRCEMHVMKFYTMQQSTVHLLEDIVRRQEALIAKVTASDEFRCVDLSEVDVELQDIQFSAVFGSNEHVSLPPRHPMIRLVDANGTTEELDKYFDFGDDAPWNLPTAARSTHSDEEHESAGAAAAKVKPKAGTKKKSKTKSAKKKAKKVPTADGEMGAPA